MAQAEVTLDSFERHPSTYKHWKLSIDGEVATLIMDVDENEGLTDGYQLKLNSYDLGVDIELADAIQRIRFEHPEVKVVVFTALKEKIFCAGANIFMLGGSSHPFKVNFCKFTNETRLYLEDLSENSGLRVIAALNGTASGGGYELALACDEILLIDDGNSAVSLPEVPLLGVLPGTGGLTRVTDKRCVRRDLADVFSSIAEGVRGQRAIDWKLVDAVAPKSKWDALVQSRIDAHLKDNTVKSGDAVELPAIEVKCDGPHRLYKYVEMVIDGPMKKATLTVKGPESDEPITADSFIRKGVESWMFRAFRELDDAILHLRMNQLDVTLVELKTVGEAGRVLGAEKGLLAAVDTGNRFAHETLLLIRRVMKRLDVTSKTFLTLVEPDSCFAGCLAELVFIGDRSYMLDDVDAEGESGLWLSKMNNGLLPMGNGLTRLQSRFYNDEQSLAALSSYFESEASIDCDGAETLGLVTYMRDDIDYPDEVRLFIEERCAMSPDALTGMEANLRWPGPETMETRIFGRLSAWQNWIFIRPNATGPEGALTNYGQPKQPNFDTRRC